MGRMRWAIACFGVAAFAATACGDDDISGGTQQVNGSGTIVTEEREIDAYDGVELRGEGTVLVGTGSDGTVVVETDDNLLPLIRVTVEDRQLVIETRSGNDIEPTDDVVYRLGCPELVDVSLRGAGRIDVGSCATDADLALELSGAGTIHADELALASVDATLSGAGSIEMGGTADLLDATVSGAGDIDAVGLEAAQVDATVSGGGEITVWAIDGLDATVSGTGTIRYAGDPIVTERVTGVGEIESLSDS